MKKITLTTNRFFFILSATLHAVCVCLCIYVFNNMHEDPLYCGHIIKHCAAAVYNNTCCYIYIQNGFRYFVVSVSVKFVYKNKNNAKQKPINIFSFLAVRV